MINENLEIMMLIAEGIPQNELNEIDDILRSHVDAFCDDEEAIEESFAINGLEILLANKNHTSPELLSTLEQLKADVLIMIQRVQEETDNE